MNNQIESALISQMIEKTIMVPPSRESNEVENLIQTSQHIRIAGPCALQTPEQIQAIVSELGDNIDILRCPDKKPRTRPVNNKGELLFQGIGHKQALPIYQQLRSQDIVIAAEVMNASDTHALSAVLGLPWVGSRNSNSETIQEIGEACRINQLPLMVKNPLVKHMPTYIGMIESAIVGSRAKVPIIACIRGIHPTTTSEENIWRNVPNLEWVSELKTVYPSLPVIVDPSHMIHPQDTDSAQTVEAILNEAYARGANGHIVEVALPNHPSKTDKGILVQSYLNMILKHDW